MSAAAPRHKSRHRGIYFRNGSADPKAPGARRWIVWYRDSDGNGRTETLPPGSSEQDALQRQSELRGAKRRGQRVMPTRQSLRDAGEAWYETRKADPDVRPKTLAADRWGLDKAYKYFGGWKKLTDITTSDAAGAIAAMKRDGLSGDSIRNALKPVRAVYRLAKRDHGLVNPLEDLTDKERPKTAERKMRILDSAEIEAVIERTPESFRTLIRTLIFTGLRISEALALRWADVDFESGRIHVRQGKTENASRSIVLMPALAGRLREHRMASRFKAPTDLVFCTSKGHPYSPSNVRTRGLNKALAELVDDEGRVLRAAIPHARLHDLRHTFASVLIGQGFDVTLVADQLGHGDPAITLKVYAKLFDPERRRDEARERLEAAFGGMV